MSTSGSEVNLNLIKANEILAKVLDHLAKNNFEDLKAEGALRLSGSKTEVNKLYSQMQENINIKLQDKDVHDLIGVVKEAIKNATFSDPAKKILQEYIENNNPSSMEECIDKLNEKELVEEAKLLQNMMFLCGLVNNIDGNKMNANTITIAMLGPKFAELVYGEAQEPEKIMAAQLFASEKIYPKLQHEIGKDKFTDRFETVHEAEEQNRAEAAKTAKASTLQMKQPIQQIEAIEVKKKSSFKSHVKRHALTAAAATAAFIPTGVVGALGVGVAAHKFLKNCEQRREAILLKDPEQKKLGFFENVRNTAKERLLGQKTGQTEKARKKFN